MIPPPRKIDRKRREKNQFIRDYIMSRARAIPKHITSVAYSTEELVEEAEEVWEYFLKATEKEVEEYNTKWYD